MKLILVRHGQSEHNAGITENKDSKLTKKGRMQAERLGKRLKREKIKFDKIYTSNMVRSKETAKIISKITGIPIKKSFGELNEYKHHHLLGKLRTLMSLRLRALKKLLKEISKNRIKDETIMIVAHGRTNKIILAHLVKIPFGNHLLQFMHRNTGFSILEWIPQYENWRLEIMNDSNHLTENLK